ncbi:hypothetical protein P1J78_20870 [Psychromarinibacter sp. C21-152]|uniref:Uncharacterized protein n=1 Tax=Psychromarinibacter sediminicola TaxID=3033385 RepID=A0AAE3TA07_9RHOB|nr:hypothetical protein [Psychromarinibacter sediminicola]MDF0603200.1 hypothetical protein [Psychromarinibacter sediminicola]
MLTNELMKLRETTSDDGTELIADTLPEEPDSGPGVTPRVGRPRVCSMTGSSPEPTLMNYDRYPSRRAENGLSLQVQVGCTVYRKADIPSAARMVPPRAWLFTKRIVECRTWAM